MLNSWQIKYYEKKIFITILFYFMITDATASTVEAIAYNILSQIKSIPDLLVALAYVSGIALGIKGILKFKENNETKGQVKLTIPIILMVSSALLLALPTLLNVGTESAGYKSSSVKSKQPKQHKY